MVNIQTTHGNIVIELDFKNTPKTAANFLAYVQKGFFDRTIFHRVINNFMIQGGGFDENMKQKTTDASIENEADTAQPNKRGTIAMARTSDPHSATAQFFINVVDNPFLNHSAKNAEGWGYCVFGKVIEGMDVVDKIKAVATGSRAGHQDVPLEMVVIEKVEADTTA
jgi:peptidyl-prolyl cis-trans isomerase B (cyclophilin B)